MLSVVIGLITALHAQAPTATQVTGEVASIESTSISVKTDKGDSVLVALSPNTAYRKVAAGATSLAGAARVDVSAITVGDRVVAIGPPPGDPKRLEARTVVIMSRADLNQKRQAEQEDWQKRGVAGTVLSIDAAAKAITIKSGARNLTIQTSAATVFHRYSADSVKFSDARGSVLADISPGDQVRVLGNKTENNVTAERIISGAFRQIAATITSLNAEGGELVVKDLATKKALTVRVNSNTAIRKLTPDLAALLTARYRGSARSANEDTTPPLDRVPSFSLAALKNGDAIMLSTTAGSDPNKVTAIMLLAGVEPLLAASPSATRDILGDWNLGSLNP